MNSDPLMRLAIDAARAAGDLLLEHYRAPARGVSSKSSPTDPVSDADRAAEDLLLDRIGTARPDDGFVTEESDGRISTSGMTWVIDPLDATVNFLFRIPWWCVSVALEDAAGALIGVILNPNTQETFVAARGAGAFLNGAPIGVGGKNDLAHALIGTGFGYEAAAREHQAAIVSRVLPRARDVRRMGSAALDLASLACGRLDGYYEAPLERWDRAAGLLLVTEAGGIVTPIPGPPGATDGVVASGPGIHQALVSVVVDQDN